LQERRRRKLKFSTLERTRGQKSKEAREPETMPLYEYECTACHKRTEKIQKFSDPEITACPKCGGVLERVLSAPAIAFKGGGWFADGYGSAKPAAAGASDSSSSSSEGSGSSENKPAGDSAKSTPAPAAAPAATSTPAAAAPASKS
jgi:putative FmdB family regulatory protein